jgi:hypothetical protein
MYDTNKFFQKLSFSWYRHFFCNVLTEAKINQKVRLFNLLSVRRSNEPSGQWPFGPMNIWTSTLSDQWTFGPVTVLIGPKGHWSEVSLVRRFIGLKGNSSEGSLVWMVTGPKVHWSERSLVRRYIGPVSIQTNEPSDELPFGPMNLRNNKPSNWKTNPSFMREILIFCL